MVTTNTFPSRLLRRPPILEPLREGLPVAASIIANSDLKVEGNLFADSILDQRNLVSASINSYSETSAMQTIGVLLNETLSSIDDQTAAMLSPVIDDYVNLPIDTHNSHILGITAFLYSADSAIVEAALTGFNQALTLEKASTAAELSSHASVIEMLVRGYTALLPLLAKSSKTLSSGTPLSWRNASALFSQNGFANAGQALNNASKLSLDSYASLTAQAIASHTQIRAIDARRAAITHRISDLTLWVGACQQAQHSSQLTPAQAVQSILKRNPTLLSNAENYLKQTEKKLMTKFRPAKKLVSPPIKLPEAYGGIPVEELGF